jgi:hypothetical protein
MQAVSPCADLPHHTSLLPWPRAQLDADFAAFMDCKDPPGFAAASPAPDPLAEEAGGVASGEEGAAAARRPGRSDEEAGEEEAGEDGGPLTLCSHSRWERRREPCDPLVTGTSKTHGIPGGIICARTRHNLAKCPRVWK